MGDEITLEQAFIVTFFLQIQFILPKTLCLVTEQELYLAWEICYWLETLHVHVEREVFLSSCTAYLIPLGKEDKEKEKEQISFTLRSSTGLIYPALLLTSTF